MKTRSTSRFEVRHAALAAPALLFVAGACSTANMTDYTPVNEKTKYSEDALFRGARDAAEHLDMRVTASESGNAFDTREKEVATSSIPRLSYKYSFHVETIGGVLVIKSSCVKNSTTSEHEFSDCGDDRPARVVELQAALRKQALERAKQDDSKSADFSHFGEPEEDEKAAAKDDAKASDKKADDKKADDKKATEDKKADDKKADKADDKKADDKKTTEDKKADSKEPAKADSSKATAQATTKKK